MALLITLDANSFWEILIEIVTIGGVVFGIVWAVFNRILDRKADVKDVSIVANDFVEYKSNHAEKHDMEKAYVNEKTEEQSAKLDYQTTKIDEVVKLSSNIKDIIGKLEHVMYKESEQIAEKEVKKHVDSLHRSTA